MKVGDILLNEYAGNKNPHKISIIINIGPNYTKCLDSNGKIIQFYTKDLKTDKSFKIIARIDIQGIISEYNDMYKKGDFN